MMNLQARHLFFLKILVLYEKILIPLPHTSANKDGTLLMFPKHRHNSLVTLCQVKQESVNSLIELHFQNTYISLTECRSIHPSFIFTSGLGILLWPTIFLLFAVFAFFGLKILTTTLFHTSWNEYSY